MDVSEFLSSQGFLVLDGGLATELERRGADLSDRLWSAKQLLEGPELIRLIHEAYFAAGADVAVSASYQASLPGFAASGLSERKGRELMRLSVELAREVLYDIPNVEITGYAGLTVEYARQHGLRVVVRGLRAVSDFEFEFQLATMSRHLSDQVDYVFLTPTEQFNFISSTLVREIDRRYRMNDRILRHLTVRVEDESQLGPSPMMKPSRSLSNGRLARCGSSLRVDSARIAANPPTPIGVIEASDPPAIITSPQPSLRAWVAAISSYLQ